jgi:hypothetical protein
MINWIEVVGGSLPPCDMPVLLYIVQLHHDNESLADEFIITGFYSNEEKKWGYDFVEEGRSWKYFEDINDVRVVAWTLLPPLFDYEKYKDFRKKFGFNLFR